MTPAGFTFDFEEVPVLVHASAGWCAASSSTSARWRSRPTSARRRTASASRPCPIFLVRGFHHEAIQRSTTSGIAHPKDLEGRKVGVSRGYTVTTGVWARAILAREYGVDLDSITWVLSGDEHVAEYVPPPNVVSLEPGRTFDEMLATGELAAVIGAKLTGPDVVPLLPDPVEAGFAALQHRGLYPINHLVVVKDELLEASTRAGPGRVRRVRPRQEPLRRAAAHGRDPGAGSDGPDVRAGPRDRPAQDPLPYGIAPNRRHDRGAHRPRGRASTSSTGAPPVDALFAPATLDLTA